MKTIIKTNFLILLSGIVLNTANASLQEIKEAEGDIMRKIFCLCTKGLQDESLKTIILDIESACKAVEKAIKDIKGQDLIDGKNALIRLKSDLAFFKAISTKKRNRLIPFAKKYRYSLLLEKLGLLEKLKLIQ